MHIPSERIYKSMLAEHAHVWYVPANDGDETALLIKSITPSLKALIAGCQIQLLFGKKDNYLCTGARIYDMPDSPLLLSEPQIVLEEHMALVQSMKQMVFPIFLFNERDICVASSTVEISEEDSSALLELMGNEDSLYTGKFNDDVSFAVDCFDTSIDKTRTFPNAYEIPIIEITPKIGKWETYDVYFVNNDSHGGINIAAKTEGENFENIIRASLDHVFPSTLYKNPQIQHGDTRREFTDIFAYYEYRSFLIEAKDLSVIQAGFNKNEAKRLAGIQKQAEKAIKQLIGAVNAFKRGDALFDAKGNMISVDRNPSPHCIILITELMTCGDWSEITKQLLEASEQTYAFFHLFDLRELITLIKKCSGDPALIDYNLVERYKLFIKNKNVFIRGT